MNLISKKSAVMAAAVALLTSIGAGAAIASGDDNASDRPITGSALDRAERAALAETGGGTVTGTEVGDEESRYESR